MIKTVVTQTFLFVFFFFITIFSQHQLYICIHTSNIQILIACDSQVTYMWCYVGKCVQATRLNSREGTIYTQQKEPATMKQMNQQTSNIHRQTNLKIPSWVARYLALISSKERFLITMATWETRMLSVLSSDATDLCGKRQEWSAKKKKKRQLSNTSNAADTCLQQKES